METVKNMSWTFPFILTENSFRHLIVIVLNKFQWFILILKIREISEFYFTKVPTTSNYRLQEYRIYIFQDLNFSPVPTLYRLQLFTEHCAHIIELFNCNSNLLTIENF